MKQSCASQNPAEFEPARALAVADVSMRYRPDSPWVLRALEFSVAPGEFTVILGPSGSGKSTLLRLIAGFEMPTRGRIYLGGRLVAGGQDGLCLPPEQRGIGYVFQSYALWPHKTVTENIRFPLRMNRVSAPEQTRRVSEMMIKLGINELAGRYPAEISGGQKQRVALARAIINRPHLLIMDEPLSSLDVSLRRSIQQELIEFRRQWQPTVLYVTHDQEEAMRLADRIIILHQGMIEQQGTADQLYHSPATRFIAGFFGESNLCDGVVHSVDSQMLRVLVPGLGECCARSRIALSPGDAVTLLVRPSWMALSEPTSAQPETDFTAVVEESQFFGQHTLYSVRQQGLRLKVSESGRPRFPSGGGVTVTIRDAWVIPSNEVDNHE